ncbi:hypothetical protein H671_1g4077 [Cricetulus griseus]|nr:hypothetical protein H671_1g4077 [Cricetulus griseus]
MNQTHESHPAHCGQPLEDEWKCSIFGYVQTPFLICCSSKKCHLYLPPELDAPPKTLHYYHPQKTSS